MNNFLVGERFHRTCVKSHTEQKDKKKFGNIMPNSLKVLTAEIRKTFKQRRRCLFFHKNKISIGKMSEQKDNAKVEHISQEVTQV